MIPLAMAGDGEIGLWIIQDGKFSDQGRQNLLRKPNAESAKEPEEQATLVALRNWAETWTEKD